MLSYNSISVQKIMLLISSFIFYGFADVRFLPFLIYIIIVTYCASYYCKNKVLLFLFIAIDILPLAFIKYFPKKWIFPLGLSFFTFQSLGYIIDVFTQKIKKETNFLNVCLFLCFFPTVSNGPILRANDFFPQLNTVHKFDYKNATDGMKLICMGLFKKFFIADNLASYINSVLAIEKLNEQYGLAVFLACILYSFYIYCDFSGYTDMAVGIAKYLGFNVGKNFNKPYLSKSISEFWTRWHISLSSWLRDYIYIPLGGSRVSKIRTYINLFITFLVSGIWHGSTMNFLVWGLLHASFLCLERFLSPLIQKFKIPSVFKILITFIFISFTWIFFRASSLHEVAIIFSRIVNIPYEISMFVRMRLNHQIGIIGAIRQGFADEGFFRNLTEFSSIQVGLYSLLALMIFDFTTKGSSELISFKAFPVILRWGFYLLIAFYVFYKILPMLLYHNLNTSFLYFDF